MEDIHAVASQIVTEVDPEAMIVQVGVNDVGSTKSEELIRRYRDLLACMKSNRRRVVVTGILPRLTGVSTEWSSRALAANERVGKICREFGMTFLDGWDRFYGRWDLYQRDGLHFSERGVHLLSSMYEQALQGN